MEKGGSIEKEKAPTITFIYQTPQVGVHLPDTTGRCSSIRHHR